MYVTSNKSFLTHLQRFLSRKSRRIQLLIAALFIALSAFSNKKYL